jgi:hypothetical protein
LKNLVIICNGNKNSKIPQCSRDNPKDSFEIPFCMNADGLYKRQLNSAKFDNLYFEIHPSIKMNNASAIQ